MYAAATDTLKLENRLDIPGTTAVAQLHSLGFRLQLTLRILHNKATTRNIVGFAYPLRLWQVSERAADLSVVAATIQGYEPLMPQSIPYTRAILGEAVELGIPTSLVSNGVFLAQAADELVALQVNRVGVSLDSHDAKRHDRIRGVSGAWHTTVAGIKSAQKRFFSSQTTLEVLSVLLPGRTRYLLEMPSLLKELGINVWITSPIIQANPSRSASVTHGSDRMIDDLRTLQTIATRSEIDLVIDDEFNLLPQNWVSNGGEFQLRKVPSGITVARLLPSGQCSFGQDIANVVGEETPRWAPAETHAAKFVSSSASCRDATGQESRWPTSHFHVSEHKHISF